MPFTAPTLTGRWVQLEPLAESHRNDLRTAADDDRIWEHTLPVVRELGFNAYFDEALAQQQAGQRITFAVRHVADNQLVGSTSYHDYSEQHRRVEIGGTWYAPYTWGTTVNPESKLLLLRHAFEVLGVNRVAFITSIRNERSQAAIAKLGAVREGVLRSHRVQGGRIRDSVLFSIVAAEWPTVRASLVARLGG